MISDFLSEVYGDFHNFLIRGKEHYKDLSLFDLDTHSRKLCNKKGCEKCGMAK